MMTMAMKRWSPLVAAALMAGCASQTPPAQVTRFHLGQPIAKGEIAIEPRDPAQGSSLEFEGYSAAISDELRKAGFTIAPNLARSELVAAVEVNRASHVTGPARSPFSIGIGGGTFGRHVGVGGGVDVPIGKAKAPEAVRTDVFIQIKRRSEGTAIWEARGQLDAREGTPYAVPSAAVGKIVAAMFRDFPGRSGQTISVK